MFSNKNKTNTELQQQHCKGEHITTGKQKYWEMWGQIWISGFPARVENSFSSEHKVAKNFDLSAINHGKLLIWLRQVLQNTLKDYISNISFKEFRDMVFFNLGFDKLFN